MQISLDRLVLCIGASIVEDSGKIEYLDQSQGDRENNKGDADIPDHNFDGCVYLWNGGGAVSQHECGDNVCEPGNNGQAGKFLPLISGRESVKNPDEAAQQQPFGDPVCQECGQDQADGDDCAVNPRVSALKILQLFPQFRHVHSILMVFFSFAAG